MTILRTDAPILPKCCVCTHAMRWPKQTSSKTRFFFRFWFSFVLNIFLLQFLMSDVFLRSALHLLELEEFDEAAFFAEKSAEIEKGIDSHFDAHLAFCVATECYAKAKFLLLARLLH